MTKINNMTDHNKTKSNKTTGKTTEWILISLAAVFLLIMIICGAVTLMVYYKGFYISQYQNNKVYQSMVDRGFSPDIKDAIELGNNATDNLIDYFKGKQELRYFDEKETSHMRDVKIFLSTITVLYYTSILFFIIIFIILYNRHKKDIYEFIHTISKILLTCAITGLAGIIILGLMSVLYFDITFSLFHAIFFAPGTYLFDTSSLLITLFPEKFFFNIAIRIYLYIFFQCIIFLLIGWWMNKEIKLYKKFKK